MSAGKGNRAPLKAHPTNGFLRLFSGLVLVCAAVAAGTWSGVAISEWLDPVSEDEANLAADARGADRERPSPVAGPGKPSTGAQGKGWIADVWSGPRRTGAFRVSGIAPDGSVEAQCVDAGGARRGFGELIRRALRQRGKAPLDERYARLAKDPFDTPEARRHAHGSGDEDDGPAIYPGDVYITGLPMVDQGNRAYCAVAAAARVLQGYGIEVTMEDLAELAHSSEAGGTNSSSWEQAIDRVAREHGLKLNVVAELTETEHPIRQIVDTYNFAADELGYGLLNADDYLVYGVGWQIENYTAMRQDREYPVQREVMVSDDDKGKAFDDNVISRIDDSDPLFWSVTLGDVAEEVPHGNDTYLSRNRGGHMRLIIGYNEDRGEVLYSDSWGEGHELKRMDACDALSITTAMYYLAE